MPKRSRTPHIPYQKPDHLNELVELSIDRLRVDLARRIHCKSNRKSTAAFMDNRLCYFEPATLLDVVVTAMPELDMGSDPAFTNQRRRLIASAVDKLRHADAVEEWFMTPDRYCAMFRLCLGRGHLPPAYVDVQLVPVRPWFFWSDLHEGVPSPAILADQRRRTGLAALRWVAPLNGKGGKA